ncbi:polysaccharide deacetylase family protein [Aliiglaciecola lipolytica]|uniref:Polysaccharide deacetylase n=1 Tax=Aliiglaciecola lipolytica E3 TaxID=1127673 RepID=K6X7H8_9ALTE|nr:polysaccharide deacetylase family protein [Aliiglaciecola lipolytica]GAC16579.1 polysaccharide deacetylase [Aliiglaciecola lipolytica E3]
MKKGKLAALNIALMMLLLSVAKANESVTFPNGERIAVSLSYDDALDSQLDKVVPALNRHDLRASFYVYASADSFSSRLEDWRAVAKFGHELGNHSLYHVCSGSAPNRDWVAEHADLDKRSVAHMRAEISIANSLLQALDGQTQRTFTIPCGDVNAGGKNYLPAVEDLFVAIKGMGLEDGSEVLHAPSAVDGETLINYVRNAKPGTKVVSILFHGVGGDHLQVTEQAHEALLQYLAKHREQYWVDSYINIMRHMKAQ